MAGLTEQVTQETWEIMCRMLGIGAGMAGDALAAGGEVIQLSSQAIQALINKIHEGNYSEQFEAAEDGTVNLEGLLKKLQKDKAAAMSMSVADEDVATMKKHFESQNIAFIILSVGQDDTNLFVYSEADTNKADMARQNFQIERGLITELNPSVFFNMTASSDIGTVSGLSNVELELFRFHAKHNGLMFTSIVENGTNTIIYDLNSGQKAKNTVADILWDCSGEEGELIKTQLEHKISNRQAVNIAFLDGEREYYIVNGNNPENYIHITANDFEYYKKNQKVYDVSRASSGFMDRAIRAVNGYDTPILLDKATFEQSSSEELSKHIENAMRNSFNNEVMAKAIEAQLQKRFRIEEKMQLDDENQGNFWLFDDSISYSEGSTNETFNDLDDDQKEEIGKLQKAAERFKFNEYKADDKNLDTLIAKAEEQRNRGYRYAEEPEQVI